MDDAYVCWHTHTHTWSMSCKSMKQQNNKNRGKLPSPHRSLKFKVASASFWCSRRHVREVRAVPVWKLCSRGESVSGSSFPAPLNPGQNLLISAWVGRMSTSITFVLFVLPCSIREKQSLTCLESFDKDETYCSLWGIRSTDKQGTQKFSCKKVLVAG